MFDGALVFRGPGGRASPKRRFEAFIRIAEADLRSVEMFWIEVFANPVQQFFMQIPECVGPVFAARSVV